MSDYDAYDLEYEARSAPGPLLYVMLALAAQALLAAVCVAFAGWF
jgi:hypothetical protein